MRSAPIPRLRRVRRRLLTSVVAAAAILATGAVAPGPAGAAPPSEPGVTRPGFGTDTHAVTLLTGDVVLLQRSADGRQAAWIGQAADPAAPRPHIYQQDGRVHVIPAEAEPYLAAGVLDPNLFDVTALVQQGFADQDSHELPLLVQSANRQAAPQAAPAGTRRVRTLDGIASISVVADKTHIRAVWNELRGPRPAAAGTPTARLATAGHVWLNARVHTTMQDGAAQIGAAQAWSAGYDGRGVHVAVLDTGYDPTHPDLAGRVSTARNFTPDVDPPGATAVDLNGHGTHVAATVAGSGKAEGGRYAGVAPGADLWIGKVIDHTGYGFEDEIMAGMQWAADSGADVINMSIGLPYISDGTDPMSQLLDGLSQRTGALFVVAAGNSGPDEQTVVAPGSAELALTVGAVDGNDDAASFSSRGPRYGDAAIKPEIVAPGVDVVSARAAGTSEGNLLDRYYTSLSGTSMAAPHVAGAAALLKQEHPDWTGPQLKARLVGTSRTLPGLPVTFQGAGRVDIAAATGGSVTTDSAVLSLGHVSQDGGAVTRTLTYRNPTDHSVRLRLSADVHGTGTDAKVRPDLSFGQSNLVVPAHGAASTQVTLHPDRTDEGVYAGDVLASGGKGRSVHSVISFVVDGPLRTLTVQAVDRAGHPAFGAVDLFNNDTGEYLRRFMSDGTATFQVQDGTYTEIAGFHADTSAPLTQTVAGDPQLVVDGDTTVRYDARAGHQVTVDTPRETDLDYWNVGWTRSIGGRSLSSQGVWGKTGQQLYVIPSAKASHGSFQFSTEWQLAQPKLTAQVSGRTDARVTPNAVLVTEGKPFNGTVRLPVVFAGSGAAEDYAGLDAHGKIALVTRVGDSIEEQMRAATDAGAALLLVQDTKPGWRLLGMWKPALSAYSITDSAGTALRAELAANPALTLDVNGVADATYAYELAFPETQLPASPHYRADPGSVATVVSEFRHDSPRQRDGESWVPFLDTGVLGSLFKERFGPGVRTDYLSTRGVSWSRLGHPFEVLGQYPVGTAEQQYQPGRTYRQLWYGPLVAPGLMATAGAEQLGSPVARFRDGIRIAMPAYYYGSGIYGFIQSQYGDTEQLELRRNDQVVGTASRLVAQFTVPAGPATYDLTATVHNGDGNWADTSTDTKSTWRFVSERSTGERTVLPLVSLQYGLDADSYNAVPAGKAYPLTITPGYQPQATGPGTFTVTAEVSYGDGKTWAPVPVQATHGQFRAMLPAASPSAGFASVRVVATDRDGNRLTQEIDRAWRIAS